MKNRYAYADEREKSYGLAGIVISLNVLDADDKLHRVDIDAPDGESVTFTPDFYFYTNPRYSARITWNETIKQYQLLVGMIVGNVMCRSLVMKKTPLAREVALDLRALVDEEGSMLCSLEKDEIDNVFNKTYHYLGDVFSNADVHYLVDGIAATLLSKRAMAGDEIADLIAYLRRR